MENTADKIIEIIKNESLESLNTDTISLSESLGEQGLDSLDRASLFFAIEETFSVKVSDEQVENLDTIKDIVLFIEQNQN